MGSFPKSFLITGANRGLGFEMVKQVVAKYSPKAVFATYRDITKAEELIQLSQIHPCIKPVLMDVSNLETFASVVKQIDAEMGNSGLDVLINNAGFFIKENQSLDSITKNLVLEYLQVNTFGPLFVTQAFLPLLEKAGNSESKKAVILTFSSRLGSIEDNQSGGYYASRTSRAASNAITKSISIDVKDKNILIAAINPGWVKTDQGGENAPLTPEESVSGILNVFENLTPSQSGLFFQYNGTIIPW
ncbi:C-factor [Folsomia candida]|uniref:C-factor n=1 Tax=Folsomia candida TaxID=158441 RepID=UPI0016053B05|nr:C-factor [Folsomia candida]